MSEPVSVDHSKSQKNIYISTLVSKLNRDIQEYEKSLASTDISDKDIDTLKNSISELSVLLKYITDKKNSAASLSNDDILGLNKLAEEATHKLQTLSNENDNLESQINTYNTHITEKNAKSDELYHEIQQKLHDLKQKNMEQDKYKKELIAKRRMLELSQEKNIYKKKVIYTLMSAIIVVILAIVAIFTAFGKK